MTDDLIGRAEAQTAIQFAAKRYTVAHEAHGEGQVVWSDNLINVTDAMNVLRDLPSVQPERKTGRWIEMSSTNHTYKCSVCGRLLVNITDGKNNVAKNYPYCHCGADMRGEQE